MSARKRPTAKASRVRRDAKRNRQLEEAYNAVVPTAQRLADEMEAQFTQLLGDQGIALSVPIQKRVKKWPSIKEKLERKALSLSSITELGDLVGLRLILLFQRDIARVCTMVE